MLLEYKCTRGILSRNSDIQALKSALPDFIRFIVFNGFYTDLLLTGNNHNVVLLFEK